jgi:ABC-type lipoprotein release transport system permease subunit
MSNSFAAKSLSTGTSKTTAIDFVRTYDPVTFVGAPILLLLSALVACGAPAWYAAHIEPNEALRAE